VSVDKAKSGYLPSLDGWRTFAILGVIMTHDSTWHLGPYSNQHWKDYGAWGVWLFFAISGVLICGRILQDEAVLGAFHLKSFYIRRICRIQPPALCYLAVIAVLMIAGVVHDTWHGWFASLFLYQNFFIRYHYSTPSPPSGFTGHFWSLSVEEHFYVLLSLFLFFVRRNRIAIMGTILVVVIVGQHIAGRRGYFSPEVSSFRTYWQIQFLLLPSLFALLLRREDIYKAAVRYLHPWVAFVTTILLMYTDHILTAGFHTPFFRVHVINDESGPLLTCFGLWVVATMLHPKSLTTRFLELPPLRYVGRLSYSIYLWFVLFFSVKEPIAHITWMPLVDAGHVPWRYIGTMVCAVLSYYLIERPMIRLGHRLAPPATAGHSDLSSSNNGNKVIRASLAP
jgi:peptidoglycan/LPS O-acetylase OafA/YrhL